MPDTRSSKLVSMYNAARKKISLEKIGQTKIEIQHMSDLLNVTDEIVIEYQVSVQQNLNLEDAIHRITKSLDTIKEIR